MKNDTLHQNGSTLILILNFRWESEKILGQNLDQNNDLTENQSMVLAEETGMDHWAANNNIGLDWF